MYASTADSDPRICTAYFVRRVHPEHGGQFAADLRAWAEGGPFRLFVVADDAADTLTGAARELVERTLGRLARRGAIERIAVSGPGRLAGEVAALDGQLAAPVRLFTEAWHDAQAWLRSPSPPSDA